MTKDKLEAMLNATTHVYVGHAKCGCAVAVVSDVPGMENETAEAVKEYISDGLLVSRITLQEFREMSLGHKCGKNMPKQESLAL